MSVNFLEEDVKEVAKSLPDLMEEVETEYEITERNSGYENGPEGELIGATAKYSVKIPEEGVPYSREDLERVFGASATLQVWDTSEIDSFDDLERKAQLYTNASRTTPRDKRTEESETLHSLLTTDIEEVMNPEPDQVEPIDSNTSRVYRWNK